VSRSNLAEAPATVSLYGYPDGSFSGTAYLRRAAGHVVAASTSRDEWYWSLTDDERHAANLQRANRHAAQDLMRKVRQGNLRRLLTFTNGGDGEGWQTLRESVRDVLDWYLHHGGRELLGDTPLVCVPERGENGRRIHVHGAIRSGYRLDYSAIIASWSAYLTSHGFVSTAASGLHRWHAGDEQGRGKDGFSSARTCADYMAKYLVKGFESDARVKYEKRFRSDGCLVPEPRRVSGFPLGGVPAMLKDTFGVGEVHCVWFDTPNGKYGGWWVEVDGDDD